MDKCNRASLPRTCRICVATSSPPSRNSRGPIGTRTPAPTRTRRARARVGLCAERARAAPRGLRQLRAARARVGARGRRRLLRERARAARVLRAHHAAPCPRWQRGAHFDARMGPHRRCAPLCLNRVPPARQGCGSGWICPRRSRRRSARLVRQPVKATVRETATAHRGGRKGQTRSVGRLASSPA